MGHLRAREITIELEGGAEVVVAATPALEGELVAAAAEGAGGETPAGVGAGAIGGLMRRWPAVVASGAILGWSGIIDDAGDAVPYSAEAAADLRVDVKFAILAAVFNWLWGGPVAQAAKDAGLPDPTAADPPLLSEVGSMHG